MSDATYGAAAGFVQFDPKEREVNGQQVRNVNIRAVGSQKKVDITIWPDHAETPVKKGDFVAADGKVTLNEKDGVTYINLSASQLLVIPAAPKAKRETVNTEGVNGSGQLKSDEPLPF